MHVLPNNDQLPKIPLVENVVPTETPKYPIPLVEPVAMPAENRQ
jgi:hypothetical protein